MSLSHTTPLQITPTLSLKSRVTLAPMAGVTDAVFRSLVRRWAPESLVCTEMISANGLVFSKRWDAKILDKTASDHPIAFQLSSSRQDVLLEAAENVAKYRKPDLIDLNMGCPVKKITGNFEGCSLMRDLDTAYALISRLASAVDVPISVKFRLGWDAQSMNYVAFGQMAEAAGAKLIALHARTRAQGYAPGCKWEAYGELKRAVRIPVIANGDITSLADAEHILSTYGVDGVMIGRGAQGQPWLLGQIDQVLRGFAAETQSLTAPSANVPGVRPAAKIPDTLAEKLAVALEHAELLADYRGEGVAVREMRTHLPKYVYGIPGASALRAKLTQVSTVADVAQVLDEVLACAHRQSFEGEANRESFAQQLKRPGSQGLAA
ncbi:MAG: tRNA-dihydrouridine synthase [Vampirovibrionales bacterium]|nr:tRNA-dihydrouridine synthase [Vampirovibrionales bacterium]